jgi:uncharacterized protein YjbJ (UPF0337 family)
MRLASACGPDSDDQARAGAQVVGKLQHGFGDLRVHRELVGAGAAVELDGGVCQRLEDAESVRKHLQQPHGRGGDAGMAGQHHARASFRARRLGAEPADVRGARMAISNPS